MVRRSVRTGLIGMSALSLALIGATAASAESPTPEPAESSTCLVERWFTSAARWVESVPQRVSGAYERTLERARERLGETLGVRVFVPGDRPGEWQWVRPEDAGPSPNRLVLLVHGLDDPGTIWDETAPALAGAGLTVARFDYANDQPIARSADELAASLADLRARGVQHIDIVAHSMGGLVTRDVLTRCEHYAGDTLHCNRLPVVDRLITFGTPNAGAPLARLRAVTEIRDQLERLNASGQFELADLLGFVVDGAGEAGDDLLPGSAYLEDLNSRPLPSTLQTLTVEGRALPVGAEDFSIALNTVVARAVLREDGVRWAEGMLDAVASAVGDGAVPAGSVPLAGAGEHIVLDADHRSMLRRVPAMAAVRAIFGQDDGPPPGVALLLERLVDPESGDTQEP